MFCRPVIQLPAQPLSDLAIGDSIAEKIVAFLKKEFLERKDQVLSLDFVLASIKELDLSEDVKTILINEVLPSNPRIKFANGQVSFIPPFQITGEDDLRALIHEKAKRHEGVFEGDVEDSTPCSGTLLRSLQKEKSIITVLRMDDKKVLFGVMDDLPKLKVDKDIQCIFHSISTRYLDHVDIYKYLKHRHLNPMQAAWKMVIPPPTRGNRKPPQCNKTK